MASASKVIWRRIPSGRATSWTWPVLPKRVVIASERLAGFQPCRPAVAELHIRPGSLGELVGHGGDPVGDDGGGLFDRGESGRGEEGGGGEQGKAKAHGDLLESKAPGR